MGADCTATAGSNDPTLPTVFNARTHIEVDVMIVVFTRRVAVGTVAIGDGQRGRRSGSRRCRDEFGTT